MTRNSTWIIDVREKNLPRFNELPTMGLYLDQVVEYVNEVTQHLFENPVLTKGMVNNYVKHKVMPAPDKKRYSQDHLAYLISISILKSVLSIPHVAHGIEEAVNAVGISRSYDVFIDNVEELVGKCIDQLKGKSIVMDVLDEDAIMFPLRAIVLAFAAKIVADYSFNKLISKGES